MKSVKFLLPLLIIVGLVGAISFASVDFSKEQKGLLKHVVCFKFKDDAKPTEVDKVVQAFKDLQDKIPTIISLECGTNVSPENLTRGFTHCFILTFKSAKDRDAYLPHPAHRAFGGVLGPVMAKDGVMVIDFWTK